MTLHLGALRDPPGTERGAPIGRLIGESRETLPEAWDLTTTRSRTPDQRGESCYGHATACALRTISRGKLDPSAMAIWTLARQLEQPTMTRLRNEGVYTHRVYESLERWGVVDRARWPDDALLEQRVTIDVLEAGATALVNGVYRISETGEARSLAIRRAVSQWHPVTFGMGVGVSFKRYTSGLWIAETDAIEGAHAMCIVGYRPEGVRVANSWGPGWGENGYAWVAWSWFESGDTFDLQAMTVAPWSLR